jgi:hypothetical protein
VKGEGIIFVAVLQVLFDQQHCLATVTGRKDAAPCEKNFMDMV